MSKPTVAVIFGSRSAEHDVSIVTALSAVIKPLELSKRYEVLPIYIAKDGGWYSDPSLKNIKTYQNDDGLANLKPILLQFDGGLTIVWPGLKTKRQTVDIAFPATHGTNGEDGTLMGLLELANIPYVGCDVASSANAMDKVLSKLLTTAAGINTPKMEYINTARFSQNPADFCKKVVKNLEFPVFVKPAHLGSSIGITRVDDQKDLLQAIEVALHYDDKILVEEAVRNLVEITVPIIGNDELTVAQTEQPIQGEDFFDFETKYLKQGKGKTGAKTGGNSAQGYSHIPAQIGEDLQQQAIEMAQAVYRAVGCQGIARIDLLLNAQSKQLYFNEINPLPGSLYAHNWRASGVSNVELVTKLVELALSKHASKQKRTTIFSTNFLKQF